MKVNYLPKNRLRHPYLRRIFILAVIFILGAISFSFLDGVIVSAISPIWKAENALSRNLRQSLAFFGSKKALVEENVFLQEKIRSLEIEVRALESNRVQEETLLELLGRKGTSDLITASVLTRPPQTPYDVIVIDAGSNDSITIGSEVLLPEGPLLGLISDILPGSSRVKLFSANGLTTNAVLERGSVPAILTGTGGGNFKLALPREVVVEEGDRILSTGLVAHHLATVGEVSMSPTDSFKEVLAKSPTNIFTLRFVFVKP